MKPVLVLGLGNRLMMDDGIGVAVVEALAAQGPADERVQYAVGETDFDYCLEVAADCESLIVVDAAVTGRRPGEVSVFPMEALATCRPGLSLHNLHFLDLLRQRQSGQPGVLIGIEPFRVEVHFGLSRELTRQLDSIVNKVRSHIL